MSTRTPASGRPRLVALALLGCLATGSAIGLANSLVSCSPPQPVAVTSRPLSADEAERLATMRVTNFRHGRAGLHAVIGIPGAQTQVTGWIDWRRPLVYLAIDDPGTGRRNLVQATPGVLAVRSGTSPDPAPSRSRPPSADTADPTPARSDPPAARSDRSAAGYGTAPSGSPPRIPPADDWRIRQVHAAEPAPEPLDSFVALLFAVAARQPDPAEVLRRSEARWLGRDLAGGTIVDVLLGPAVAVPPTTGADTSSAPVDPPRPATISPAAPAPTSLAALGGAVRYWLDRDGRLHRFEALLAGDLPVQVEFDRSARPDLTPIAGLGGRPVRPRPVTNDEADLLAGVPAKSLAHGGAMVTLTVPTVDVAHRPGAAPSPAPAASGRDVNLRGAGWISWSSSVAYLAVRDLLRADQPTLLRADGGGVATHAGPRTSTSTTSLPLPPLPPPRDRDWSHNDWRQRADTLGSPDLDLLVNEALSVATTGFPDAAELRASAVWLRRDSLDGRKLTVYEIPKPAESGTPQGHARLRYWIDGAGLLRRLELRTRTGAFAQLDLSPGPVPYLPDVPTS